MNKKRETCAWIHRDLCFHSNICVMIVLTFPLFTNVLKLQLIVATLGCKWCKYVDTCTIHDAWIIIRAVPGAGWHSLMLSLCHGWHRHNASTWPAQHCHRDRIRETEKRALNWFPTDTISLCKCVDWCDNIDAMYSSRILRLIDHALLVDHFLLRENWIWRNAWV